MTSGRTCIKPAVVDPYVGEPTSSCHLDTSHNCMPTSPAHPLPRWRGDQMGRGYFCLLVFGPSMTMVAVRVWYVSLGRVAETQAIHSQPSPFRRAAETSHKHPAADLPIRHRSLSEGFTLLCGHCEPLLPGPVCQRLLSHWRRTGLTSAGSHSQIQGSHLVRDSQSH